MHSSFPHRVVVGAAALAIISIVQSSVVLAAFTEQGATILPLSASNLPFNVSGRSASLADIDNDGDLDLMFQGSVGNQKLLRNNLINDGGAPSFTYTDVTSTMLPAQQGATWSAAWGDYNGDGKVDVFIGQENSGSVTGALLKNNGSGFTNVSGSTGLSDPGFAQNVAWSDFNNDHRLDLIIGMEGPEKHEMYLQDGTGHFSAQGAAVGLQVPFGTKSYGMAIGDYDGDGDMDVYISTCRSGGAVRNNFFKNMLKESGTLSFVDVADSNGTQNMNNTYGSQFIDLDNDGKLDLVVTGAQNDSTGISNPTKIFHNNGDGSFTDVDSITGHPLLGNVGTDLNGLKLVDYDNDGKLDLYFHDNLSGTGNQRLYHNTGNWQFTDVTASLGLSGGADTGAGGYDSTWGDLDRDGDQDLIDPNNLTFSGNPSPEKVFINDASTNGNHWLYVKLNGPTWDTTAIGSSLYATLNEGAPGQVTLRREANTDADTFNQSDLPVHFGLAGADHVDWLRIVWPDGTVQFLHNVTADQYLTVSYSTALQGDFNGDGTVDTKDYIVSRANFGSPFTMDDYNTWRAYFGKSLSPGLGSAAAVPEPAALWFVTTALIAFCGGRRRK